MMQSKIGIGFLLAICVASCFAGCLLEEGGSAESYVCESIDNLAALSTIPATAQRITIFHSKLPSLPENAFARFGLNLVYLNISHCEVSEIKPGAFAKLGALHHLILDNNEIKSIKADWLVGLTNLETLRLWQNLITEIEAAAFDHLPHLEILDIAYNQIGDCISKELLERLGKLDIIYLAKNKWPLRCRPPVIFHLEDHHVQVISDWGDSHILIAECLAHEPYALYNDDTLERCYKRLVNARPHSNPLDVSGPASIPDPAFISPKQ